MRNVSGRLPERADEASTVGTRALRGDHAPFVIDRDDRSARVWDESRWVHGERAPVRVAAGDGDGHAGTRLPLARAVETDAAPAAVLTQRTARGHRASQLARSQVHIARLHEWACNRGGFMARLNGLFEPCRAGLVTVLPGM